LIIRIVIQWKIVDIIDQIGRFVLTGRNVHRIAEYVGMNTIQTAFVYMEDAGMLVPVVVVMHFVVMESYAESVVNVVRRRICVLINGFFTCV